MDVHKNAPLTPKGRETMVRSVIEGGSSKAAAARQFNTTPKIVAKWVERFRAGGSRRSSLTSSSSGTTGMDVTIGKQLPVKERLRPCFRQICIECLAVRRHLVLV
jgi:transposase-like protein